METELTPPMTLPDQLRRRLERAAARAAADTAKAQVSIDARDELIRQADEGGASLREIGSAVGLSHMGVSKILKRYRKEESQ